MNKPVQTDELPKRPCLSRRRLWSAVLYLCLLAALVFAAWQIHMVWEHRQGPRVAGEPYRAPAYQAPATLPTTNPVEMAAAAVAASGLTEFQGDPGGIAPPAGAVRLRGFQRSVEGQVQQQAHYEWAGQPLGALDHYARILGPQGFARSVPLRGTQPAPNIEAGDELRAVFFKGRTRVTVALRKNSQGAKIVTIIVFTVIRPAP